MSTMRIMSWNICLTETRKSNSSEDDISSGSWWEFLQSMMSEEVFQQFCDLLFENLEWVNEIEYDMPTGSYKHKMKYLFNNFNKRFVFDRSFVGKYRKAFDYLYGFSEIIDAIKNFKEHRNSYDIILEMSGHPQYYVDLFEEHPELYEGCKKELASKGIENPDSYDTVYKYIKYMVDFDNAIAYALIKTFTIEELENAYNSFKRINELKIQNIYNKILQVEPDIACLQETNNEFIDGFRAFDYYDVYSENNGTICTIVKKHPMLTVEPIILISEDLKKSELKEYQSLIINYNRRQFKLTNIHLASKDVKSAAKTPKPHKNYENQLKCLTELNEILIEGDKLTSILIGDFNHYSKVTSLEVYRNPEFMTEMKCRFVTRQPNKFALPSRNCKDGVMVWSKEEDLRFNSYPLIDETQIGELMLPNEQFPSDHLPIMLDVMFM